MPRINLGQKSRTGCRECKARRVKCDEQMPICGNCSKLKKSCSYLTTAPYLWRSGIPYRRSKSASKSNSSQKPKFDAVRAGPFKHAEDNQGYSLDDMRLLHHFINYTSATLSDCPEVHRTWATTVVQIAFAHPFLLQGILALAALHMGSLNANDKERLSILAASKQDAALKQFRAQLENITSKNCEAIFATSFLAEYYIPASAGTVINPAAMFMEHDFFDAIVDWLRLHQGTSEIYKSKGHWIRNCPVTPLLWSDLLGERCLSPTRKENIKHHTKTYQLRNLAKLWEKGAISTSCEVQENQINSRALDILDEAFNMLSEDSKANAGPAAICELQLDNHLRLKETDTPKRTGSSNSLSLSFAWLFEIPSGFVGLLEQRRPAALIIFAHFAVLFQNAPKFWWNEPIPAKIVKAVAAVLPKEYHCWIEWPIREVLGVDCCAM